MRAVRTLQLGWIPVVLVVALALSGFTIYRMHGVFGSPQSAGANGGAADQIVPFNSTRTPSRNAPTSPTCRGHSW